MLHRTRLTQWSDCACTVIMRLLYLHHHQFLLRLVEHTASMKSFQALRSPAIPLTSFHDLPVFLISCSIVLRHVLFGLPLLLYPWGFQSNAVFSFASASLRNVCPIQFHFLLFIWIYVGFCLVILHRSSFVILSPAIPLTSFHDLPVFLISCSIVLRHVLFGLPLLLYPWGFQSNAVLSIAPAALRNVCPIQFHFLRFIWISIGFCLVILHCILFVIFISPFYIHYLS
jgi:hypothetical protein